MRVSRPTTILHLLIGLRPAVPSPAYAIALSPASTSGYSWTSPNKPFSILAQCHATNLYASNALAKTKIANTHTHTYSTMSQPHRAQENQPQKETNNQSADASPSTTVQTESSQSTEQTKKPVLALPSSTDSTTDPTHQLDVNGDGVKLDHLGPLIVNVDGTLARISNWAQMTEIERRNTLRVIGKRNKARMEALKAKQAEEGEGKTDGEK
ncbi:hypothetical protein BJY01DRAFT_225932 [Aspergillus pseudoustus]|uniref:Fungal specific transcription factor n=1 Tax=Aspergillus pseudoustus TaxID=1810923 RepID=A0ABR4IXA6_9EURO